jgi:hypothetical protein
VRYERDGTPTVGAIQTDLTLITLDVRANRPNLPTFVPLFFYNENERSISTSLEFICFVERRLRAIHPSLTQDFGGLGALKGLVESAAPATQQNTEHPFQTFGATLLGLIETKERAPGSNTVIRGYAYSLFHDEVGVPTRFCHNVGTACPLPDQLQ